MVGRMIREAVENVIDDVKESIEEQGRQAEQARRVGPPGSMPGLQAPPPPYSSSSAAPSPALPSPAPPSARTPVSSSSSTPLATPSPRPAATPAAPSIPDRSAPPESIEVVEKAAAAVDSTEDPAVTPEEATTPRHELETIARLEDDVDIARELYRDAREDLREARRTARLAARDDRRDRRHQRRLRFEVDQGA